MTDQRCKHVIARGGFAAVPADLLHGPCLWCEIERLTRDIERGFMQGAYARLQNLQEAESERDRLRIQLEQLTAENTRMRRWITDAMDGGVTEGMRRRAAGDRLAEEPSARAAAENCIRMIDNAIKDTLDIEPGFRDYLRGCIDDYRATQSS